MRSLLLAVLIVAAAAIGYMGGYGRGWSQGYLEGWEDAKGYKHEQEVMFILDRVMFYESSYNTKAQGDFDETTRKYKAYGLYQFHYATFKYYAKMSGRPDLKWKDPEDQRELAEWMIRHGYGKEWGYAYNHALRDLFALSLRT